MVKCMKYEISNLTNEKIDENLIINVIKETSKCLEVSNKFVSVVLVDNDKIQEINKTYRGIDKPTDVISFAFLDDEISDMSDTLGEIYVSLDKVKSQSLEYAHSFERELCFLVVHGLLHLLGYDHMYEEEEKVMFDLQKDILKNIGMER